MNVTIYYVRLWGPHICRWTKRQQSGGRIQTPGGAYDANSHTLEHARKGQDCTDCNEIVNI